MTNNPAMSIITVNWNGREDLEELYPSIMQQSFKDYELIMVDNGSDDGSVEMMKEHFPEVRIIRLDKNYGFAEPNNIAFREARGKYIVTLNNDLVLAQDFLQQLFDAAEASPKDMYAIGSKLILYGNRQQINTVGIRPLPNGNGINIGKNEDPNKYNEPFAIFGPCAGAALYKKEVLDKIGFFDGRYFAYLEDLDLAHRATKAGYKATFCPKAVCYHKHSVTSSRFPFFKLYLIERNRLLNLVKHYGLGWLIIETPVTFWIIASHILSSKKQKKVSSNQKSYFQIKNVPKIIWIYIKARAYLIRHYVEFRKQAV